MLLVACYSQLSLRLDTSRNELLITNTILAVLACCFGLGAYVTGIFGMNLDNTGKLQSTPHVFNTVIVVSAFGMVCLFATLICLFRRNGVFPAKITLLDRDAEKLHNV
jgi:Mg2+ and Co2+ transporter CorA